MTHLWMPQINKSLCTGCAECITHCPTNALGTFAGKAALIRPELCTYCAACEDVCPTGAIELPYLIVKQGYREDPQDA
jgi:Na+-translocating ferredoxin:NAD+ oxidoreductase subunit B